MNLLTLLGAMVISSSQMTDSDLQVKTVNGIVQGILNHSTEVRSFKGVPFAAPPVGTLRWKAPQPVENWNGVLKADKFGPRAMQPAIFGDMVFRSNGMSEDCLYLNVWSPAKHGKAKLPVLVYFYGGGFVAGDASEPRYDGESMAQKGIVVVTVNYRLGIFGFFTHPELTEESPHHACGNYGLLDQSAAIQWVSKNIAAFGGDPKKITIGGESAGSYSVSVQMATPLARELIAGAIGESGAIFGRGLSAPPRDQAEKKGIAFAHEIGASDLETLRSLPAEKLADLMRPNPFRFGLCTDGYLLPKSADEIYSAGEQAHVPLLAGWNTWESGYQGVLGNESPTPASLEKAVRRLYPDHADEAAKLYAGVTNDEARDAAVALAGDRFISYGTWKWLDIHGKTGGGKSTYRYLFCKPRPGQPGASHSVEIEYALGNLDGNKVYNWTNEDRKVSSVMQAYFANFIKKGNPNGPDLPKWKAANKGADVCLMRIDVETQGEVEAHKDRYLFMDRLQYGNR